MTLRELVRSKAGAVVAVGLLTAVTATLTGRVQTDIKSVLAYATMTQVGLIFVEIGLGFPRVALVHMVSHGCLRVAQLLRAPSALQDATRLQAAVGGRLATGVVLERLLPAPLRARLYGLALARFHLDQRLELLVVAPANMKFPASASGSNVFVSTGTPSSSTDPYTGISPTITI